MKILFRLIAGLSLCLLVSNINCVFEPEHTCICNNSDKKEELTIDMCHTYCSNRGGLKRYVQI